MKTIHAIEILIAILAVAYLLFASTADTDYVPSNSDFVYDANEFEEVEEVAEEIDDIEWQLLSQRSMNEQIAHMVKEKKEGEE
jgi:hypothetical protein